MIEARSWLPATALAKDALDCSFNLLLKDWAANWFAVPRQISLGAAARERIEDKADNASRGGWLVSIDAKTPVDVGMSCSGLGPGAEGFTRRDKRIFHDVGAAALDDLAARLPPAELGRPPRRATGTSLRGIGDDLAIRHHFLVQNRVYGWSILIGASREALIALRRNGARGKANGRLAPVAEVLAAQHMNLGALIGTARLPFAAVRQLAPGNLLLLDAGVDDQLPMMLECKPVRGGSLRLVRHEGGVAMKIARPPTAG